MSDSYITSAAKLKCSCGDKISTLTVYPNRTVFLTDKPQANISDHISMFNIAPFGKCHSLANPTVAAATAAAHGKLTPMPCIPNTQFPWIGGKTDYLIKGQSALLISCTCHCLWAGIISITDDGQINTGETDMSRVTAIPRKDNPIEEITIRIRIFFKLTNQSINSKFQQYKKDDTQPLNDKDIQKVYQLYLSSSSGEHPKQVKQVKEYTETFVNCYIQNENIGKINVYVYGYHFLEYEKEKKEIQDLFDNEIRLDKEFLLNDKITKKTIFRGNKHQHIGNTRQKSYNKLKEAFYKNDKNANEQDIRSEIRCINLDKPIEVLTINEFIKKYKDKVLYQYALAPPRLGNYFTIPDDNGNIPTQNSLGLAEEPKRKIMKMKIDLVELESDKFTPDCNIIESTAFKAFDTWSSKKELSDRITTAKGEYSQGGGLQIIVPQCMHKYLKPVE